LPNQEGPDKSLAREHASQDKTKKTAKYPDAKGAFTLIASDLLDLLRSQRDVRTGNSPASLMIYWLSSSGQGPSLEMFTMPSNLIRFLRDVSRASTSAAWEALVRRGWSFVSDESKARKK